MVVVYAVACRDEVQVGIAVGTHGVVDAVTRVSAHVTRHSQSVPLDAAASSSTGTGSVKVRPSSEKSTCGMRPTSWRLRYIDPPTITMRRPSGVIESLGSRRS